MPPTASTQAALLAALVVVGCSDAVSSVAATGTATRGSGGAGSSIDSGGPGVGPGGSEDLDGGSAHGCPDVGPGVVDLPRPLCPDACPTDNAFCSQPWLRCSYGDDFDPMCRDRALCGDDGLWHVQPSGCATPTCCGVTPSTPDATCSQGACAFPDGAYCACVAKCSGIPDKSPPTPMWMCLGVHGEGSALCPAISPNDGAGCTDLGTKCLYGVCGSELNWSATCVNGAWVLGDGYVPN